MWKSSYSLAGGLGPTMARDVTTGPGATPAPSHPRRLRARAEASAPFRLEAHLFYYFSQILARRQRALNLELRPFGLDYARWRVMAVLNEHSGCSMQALSGLT